jgi:tRNA-Thr(GGU) m(6)t(6)A37 methyltransferase TsaA
VTRARARPAGKKASEGEGFRLRPIGLVRSTLVSRREAPRQGDEGAPDAWLDVAHWASRALEGLATGSRIVVVTWLHRARRDVLRVRPRNDRRRRLTGVFATRSADRPNPLGLHVVTVREVVGHRLLVGPIEAIDGTPVVDVKPVLGESESDCGSLVAGRRRSSSG